METTRYDHFMNRSFVAVTETFIQAVETMDSTVMFPSRLIDLPVTDIMTSSPNDACIQNNMDLKAFYLMVKAMKIQLAMGKKHVNEDGNVPFDRELAEVLQRLSYFTSVAKYIKNCALLLVQGENIPSFLEFEAKSKRPGEDCILAGIKKFVREVEEMEKAVLLPCLLKDHTLTEFGFQEGHQLQAENIHEVFSLLKLLKTELLSGSEEVDLADRKLHQKLSDLSRTFRFYTVMTKNLTTRYQREIPSY